MSLCFLRCAGMVEHGYLAEIEVEDQAPVGHDVGENLDLVVEGLRLENTFHALAQLRELQAAPPGTPA